MLEIQPKPLKRPVKLGIVISRFNTEITDRLYASAVQQLKAISPESEAVVVWVPGAVELPLIAQKLAMQADIDAVVCLGCVIRGETSHYDAVCDQVNHGCQRLALDVDKPIIFGVLTTENKAQALARSGGEHSDKGKYAIDAAFDMLSVIDQLA